jgi:hypothetical protein
LAVDALGMPVRMLVIPLIEGLDAEYPLHCNMG